MTTETKELTTQTFNEWYNNLDSDRESPENKLPHDLATPWGKIEWAVEEDRDRDNPGEYYVVIGLAGRYFRFTGSYDSWMGIDWSINYDGWVEVVEKTRTETYWEEA